MISDVLCDAKAELQWYLDEYPDTYEGESRADVEALIQRMDLILRKLMNPYTYALHDPENAEDFNE